MAGFLPPVRLIPGFALLSADNVRVEQGGHSYDLGLGVVDGRLVITRFCVEQMPGGEPVTIGLLKSVPLVGLAAAAAGPPVTGLLVGNPDGSMVTAGPDDIARLSEVERAALYYRIAFFYGLPPTAGVAEALGVSHAVAAKRVQAARRAGLLKPTTKGRKGA